ncbi:uncharacterized protein [Miscanthus floridulus]|uniref:uncharacterized protein n=1 Tax=Miscanthus floridulus TaxID=154761 RepID=UPI003459A8FF
MPEIDWNSENTRVLCMLFAEQVEKGNRPNTHLNALGYAEVEKGFKERTGIVATKVQIKNKWDKLKEDFKAWKKLMLRQTGTGWDPIKKTIAMDGEWWKKARAINIPGCGKFKKKGFENEDDLAKCFADITTIGIDHWSPHVVNVENVDETQEEATNFDPQDDDVSPETQEEDIGISPPPASGKRLARPVEKSGKKAKSGNALLIQEAVNSMASSANEYVSKRHGKYSIDEVMEVVIACGAGYDSNEHYIATELCLQVLAVHICVVLYGSSLYGSCILHFIYVNVHRCLQVSLMILVMGNFFKMVESSAKLAQSYHELYMDKAPPRFMFSQQSGMGWLMETVNTPGECHRMLRMNEVIFHDLHDVLVERYGLKPSKHINTYEMLAIFLFTCGGCESNRRGQNKFKHSGETISRKFHEVLDCVVAMAQDFLRPTDPNFRNVHKRIRNDKRAYPHFKDCIGALDGTHVRVFLSPEEQVRYIGKTGIATQNVLAVCDFDMRFTYVAAGQPGSLHDTSVLYHALEADVDVFPHPPQGKYYVVDAGYPNRPGYLAPYMGERYHLPEWHRGMEPNTPKEKVNHIHSSVRNVIERSFGVLKMKWQILYKMPGYSMATQKKIVAATMVLHNFIREHASVDVDFANFDRDPTFMPTIPERYNKYAVSQHASDGSTSESSFVTMDTFRDNMATSIALAWN